AQYLISLSLGVANYEDIEHHIIQALDKAQLGEIVGHFQKRQK
ncbi:hypothetical protein, partial [Staphylococcus aureus]